jgi:hypothetical protein
MVITYSNGCQKMKEWLKQILMPFDDLISRIRRRITLAFFHCIQLHQGSQSGCIGFIDKRRVQQICETLNAHRINSVFFNAKAIEPQINGGTCSAMSFDFIDQYLKHRVLSRSSSDKIIQKISKRYLSSSQEFMHHQAAFNTISKHSFENATDFKRDKIAAMLTLFHRNIPFCSEEINLSLPTSYEKISRNMATLPKGIFALRALHPAANLKEERERHTMVFINEADGQFFYDPNGGTLQFQRGHANKLVHNLLQQIHHSFNIPAVRFYQVL